MNSNDGQIIVQFQFYGLICTKTNNNKNPMSHQRLEMCLCLQGAYPRADVLISANFTMLSKFQMGFHNVSMCLGTLLSQCFMLPSDMNSQVSPLHTRSKIYGLSQGCQNHTGQMQAVGDFPRLELAQGMGQWQWQLRRWLQPSQLWQGQLPWQWCPTW